MTGLPDQLGADEHIDSMPTDDPCDTRKCNEAGRPTTQECQTLETDEPQCRRTQRSPARFEVAGPSHLAIIERLPPPEPGQKQDELHQATRALPDGTTFRSSGRRAASACRRPERLHRTRYPRHCGRRTNSSKERPTPMRTDF